MSPFAKFLRALEKIEWYKRDAMKLKIETTAELDVLLSSILDKAFKGEL